VSAAALAVTASSRVPARRPRHCPQAEYVGYLQGQDINRHYRNAKLRHYRNFMAAWRDMADWFDAPLVERVGRLPGEPHNAPSYPVSFYARPYIMFLALRGYIALDYAWMFGAEQLRITDAAAWMGIDLGTSALVDEGTALGYHRASMRQAIHWTVGRIALHTGVLHADDITEGHTLEVLEAVRLFSEREDLRNFYPSPEAYRHNASKQWITHLHQLQVVLFHRGQIATEPRKHMPSWKPPMTLPPKMLAVAEKWLSARKLTDSPATVSKLEVAVRVFGDWLGEHHPGIDSFADVTRDHCLGWIEHITETPTAKTGKPLGVASRIQRISGLSQFFRDTAAWQYDEVPGYTLIGAGDAPKNTQRIPRFIPVHELDRLMPIINEITCPFQRAALLVARWSGARRDEIRHLPLDCLDRYTDGTARLRLPGRKTYTERTVPLHEDAAEALQALIDLRKKGTERPFTDKRTGAQIRYLFVDHGKLLSSHYLFETSINQACHAAGLVRPGGRSGKGHGTVSAHRFRHTVGTQLAERGAKLHTIMKVLGHTSVNMALVYAQISDQEVLRDYQSVLGPEATIAGPAAVDIRSRVLSDEAVDWLKSNFLKTELELGHCLRLPTEGPCECDLYLSCAKFVTTPDYAPRLRTRLEVEQQLVQDAEQRGWTREVERHSAVIRKLTGLLTDLGQPTISDPDMEGTQRCSPTD
jgi:integrase